MRFIKTTRLTSVISGAQSHAESGNTTSNVGARVGARVGGDQWLFGTATLPENLQLPAREQLFHWSGAGVVFESLDIIQPTVTPHPNDADYNWTIIPSAENDVSKHGGVIWIGRRSWPTDPKRISPRWVAKVSLETREVLGVYPISKFSTELDSNRRQEIHAWHQDQGELIFLHERERTGAYDRSTFKKQWYRVHTDGSVSIVGIGVDHPTFRNGMLLFTTSNGIVDAHGNEWIRFEDGVACLHQCLDGLGHNVCSMQRRNSAGWLEFEIRIIDIVSKKTVATIPLNQRDQSERGNAFALLSRPFGFMHDHKYFVCYHEPAETDWEKPIAERVPQVWLAEFEMDDAVPPPNSDLLKRISSLEAKTTILEQWNKELLKEIKRINTELAKPMRVVRE